MAGRQPVENELPFIDVLRHVAAPDGKFPAETDRVPGERIAADGAGVRTRAVLRMWDRVPDEAEPDISWAINQATGGLASLDPVARIACEGHGIVVDAQLPITAGWYTDPVVDTGGVAHSTDLPSLNRRPGVVYLPPCDYIIDHPIYLYPGQILRGAGVELNRAGAPVGGSRIILRGPDARIVAIRRDVGFRGESACEGEVFGPRAQCYRTVFRGLGDEQDESKRSFVPVTPLSLDGFAVVDDRSPLEVMTDPGDPLLGWRQDALPALDLVGAQFTQIQNIVATARLGPGPGRTGLRIFLPRPDTSGYFHRIERCWFQGWTRGVSIGPGSNTVVVRDCEFTVPPGGAGLAVRAVAVKAYGNRFMGTDQSRAGIWFIGGRMLHLRGNQFEGFDRPVLMQAFDFDPDRPDPEVVGDDENRTLARGTVSATAANLVVAPEDTPWLERDLLSYAEIPDVPVGPALGALVSGKMLWMQDHDATIPRPHSQIGGANLLSYPSGLIEELRTWERRPEPWQDLPSVWFESTADYAYNQDTARDGCLGIEPGGMGVGDLVQGPAGPLVTAARRIKLDVHENRGHSRAYHVWQFVVPPPNHGPERTPADYLLRATRISGRALAIAVWIRTNIPRRWHVSADDEIYVSDWIGGVNAGLWTGGDFSLPPNCSFDDHERREALVGQSSYHSGGGRWELLTGVGFVPYSSLKLTRAASASNQALRFVIRALVPHGLQTTDGDEPYLDVCTPSVASSIFPEAPCAPLLTEDGGRLAGPLTPHLGTARTIMLDRGGNAVVGAESIRAASDWTLVAVVALGFNLALAGVVALTNADTGARIAERDFSQDGRPVSGELHISNREVPAGTRLVLEALDAPPELRILLSAAFVPRDGAPLSRTVGY